VLERTCSSLPYGDQESCAATPTEHLFTGKERDTESGNDYFGARYYASTMGRFMSPDWSAKEEPVPYAKLDDPQSLNLYAYVQNNPLIRLDKDGHDFVILNDPNGAVLGQGHNASIVGNDKGGWTYFSKAPGNNQEIQFKTFGDFQKSDVSTRYGNADRISTSTKQDAAMKDAGEKNLNKPYSVTAVKNPDGTNKSENCADLTATIGKAGGAAISTPQTTLTVVVPVPIIGTVPVSKTFTSPNQQYTDAVKNNNGTQVKAHCTGTDCK
jgi:RHS repeat-associated protein